MKVPNAFAALAGYSTVGARPDFRHEHATQIFLGRLLAELGYGAGPLPDTPAKRVAQILGGHHGCFYELKPTELNPRTVMPQLGLDKWEAQRRAVFSAVEAVFGPPPPPKRVSLTAAAVVSGLVILADWLVSQEDFLASRLEEVPTSALPQELRRHRDVSAERAVALVRQAGLGRPVSKSGSFAEEFPAFEPNALQRSVAKGLPPLLSGTGLLLVMAPMGMGKTETALHAARLLGDAAGTAGVFVTLPTMATSDQMYGRVRDYTERWVGGDKAVTLLHSMAWLNPAYTQEPSADQILAGDDGNGAARDPSRTAATEWLRGRKRGLLAPWSVGTVDQALLAVLQMRHNVLRMFGLAGKVLVVDEVHAYDAYMQFLLARLLTWLGALGAPVVLLSATLPKSVAEGLVRAYLRGAGRKRPASEFEIAYPGWVHVDAATAVVKARPVAVETRPLAVELVGVPATARAGIDRSSVLRAQLEPVFRDGGSAMVVCTTVAEAQATFTLVRDWWEQTHGGPPGDLTADSGPMLELLHARLPARQREARTARIVTAFGRDPAARPTAGAILVATQVAEQSLDLDFDLVVSDLAPVAQLLQRAGRCQRHPTIDKACLRPGWAAGGPRLTVLIPHGDDGTLVLPARWTSVYQPSLLRRTAELLRERHPAPVRIPDDVQPMVEAVYADTFSPDLAEDDIKRLMEDDVREELAKMVAVPAPAALLDLLPITQKDDLTDDQASTRLDADTVRVVCCYVDTDGRRWLDRERQRPLPETGRKKGDRIIFTTDQIRDILGESIPLRDGPWRAKANATITAPPPDWQASVALRDLLLLPHPLDPDGTAHPLDVGTRTFLLDPTLGLTG